MTTYTDIALLSLVVVYVVDVSGFTESWRSLVAKWLKIPAERLRPLPPFDCSTCAVWWSGLILAAAQSQLNFGTLAMAAGCSLLAMPVGILLNALRDLLSGLASKLGGLL